MLSIHANASGRAGAPWIADVDADGLADADRLAGGEIPAVAAAADAVAGLAGER